MQLILFLSGNTILLLAMQQMESNLSKLGSTHLQQGLQAFTRSPLSGILFGLGTTAILQSSSLVGLMTMAFVGAGMIPFRNAIGVILGCNLGTTFTGWIVTILGFKLDLAEAAMPLLGIGALLRISFHKGSKGRYSGGFIFALGLLLLALALMKDSIAFVVDYVDVESLQNLPVLVYFFFGMVLTAIIRSSSTTMIITLSAMNADIITLAPAAALIIGADLGTTSTVLIGSIGGAVVKKQVAAVHFMFNLVTDLLALACLPLLLMLVTRVFAIGDPLFALVAIHSSFNFIGILLFFPFIDQLQRWIESFLRDDDAEQLRVFKVPREVPDAALEAVNKDTFDLIRAVVILNVRRLHLNVPEARRQAEVDSVNAVYSLLKNRENLLSDWLLEVQRQPLSAEQNQRAHQYLASIRDVLYAAKAIKDVEHDLQLFNGQRRAELHTLMMRFKAPLEESYSKVFAVLDTPESFNTALLAELLQVIEKGHAQCNAYIYELIDGNLLKKESASTALNANREILFAGHSLINALENLMLPAEQARTVSEILNLKVG